jgi:hypothetical protein
LNTPAVELVADKTTVPELQRDAETGVGAVAEGFTVAVTAMRGVLSHVPLWKVTKYVRFAESEGVVKLLLVTDVALVCIKVPPVSELYQRKVPAVKLLAPKITVPVPQRLPFVTVGLVAGEFALTVAITGVRVVLSQLLLLVKLTK